MDAILVYLYEESVVLIWWTSVMSMAKVQCFGAADICDEDAILTCLHRKSAVFDVGTWIWWTLGICCDDFIRNFLMWPQKSRISTGKIPQSPKTHQNAI